MPASGYDWVAFGNLQSPAIDIALQVDFTRLRLRPKGKNTTFSIKELPDSLRTTRTSPLRRCLILDESDSQNESLEQAADQPEHNFSVSYENNSLKKVHLLRMSLNKHREAAKPRV